MPWTGVGSRPWPRPVERARRVFRRTACARRSFDDGRRRYGAGGRFVNLPRLPHGRREAARAGRGRGRGHDFYDRAAAPTCCRGKIRPCCLSFHKTGFIEFFFCRTARVPSAGLICHRFASDSLITRPRLAVEVHNLPKSGSAASSPRRKLHCLASATCSLTSPTSPRWSVLDLPRSLDGGVVAPRRGRFHAAACSNGRRRWHRHNTTRLIDRVS